MIQFVMYIFFSQSNKTTIAISIKQKQKQKKREKDTFLINQYELTNSHHSWLMKNILL